MTDQDRLLRLGGRPTDGRVISTSRPQRLVVLAARGGDLTGQRSHLRGLRMAGHSVVLMWADGHPGPQLDDFTRRHPLRPDPSTSLVEAIATDPVAQQLLAEADGVIGVGREATDDLDRIADGRTEPVPRDDLLGWATVSRIWDQVRAHVDGDILTRQYARHLVTLSRVLRVPAPPSAQRALTDLVAEMERSGNRDEAIALAPLLHPHDPDPVEAARRRAVLAQVRTSAAGAEDPDLRPGAAGLLDAVDSVLAAGDLSRAARLLTTWLGSLFHVELHGDGLSTPLVDDPDAFLAQWRRSRTGEFLARPVPRPPRRPSPPTPGRRRVVVAPGSYPRFVDELLDELRTCPGVDVDVLDWGERSDVRGLGAHAGLVEQRLRAAGGLWAPDPEISAYFDGADALFVDWADRGALLALMHVPAGVQVTLRIHSMDALSPWLHLIDWSTVDHLVVVSGHLRDLVVGLLGERLATTELHVVPNTVDLTRIPRSKSSGHLRRLLMVGWSPRVKDVEWALDILDRLRGQDPQWRLVLVGAETTNRQGVRSSRDHAERVRERIATATAAGAVEVVPATPDLAPWWRSTGFSLNTSRRESFGVALVEGVVSGAVPVVRNWPIFAGLDGARSLFPDSWVVDTVDEAVERIRAHGEPEAWEQGVAAARAHVEQHFLGADPARVLADLTLGSR